MSTNEKHYAEDDDYEIPLEVELAEKAELNRLGEADLKIKPDFTGFHEGVRDHLEVGRLNYRGDVVEGLLADPIKGPIPGGEMVTVYEATYDAETDLTTARFRYTTTADVEAENARMVLR